MKVTGKRLEVTGYREHARKWRVFGQTALFPLTPNPSPRAGEGLRTA
jgi:hypothetical protein